MGIALRELRRNPGRFGVATVTLTLIAMLLIFLGALLDGLLRSITGGYLAQPGQLVVLSSDANSVLSGSVLPAETREEVVATLPEGAEVGGFSTLTVGARLESADERDLTGVTLYGVELAPSGVPLDELSDGEVWADHDLPFTAGDVLLLGPAQVEVTVAGISDDGASPSEGGLWTSPLTWNEVQAASRPGAALPEGASQGLVVSLPDGDTLSGDDLAALAAEVDDATGTTASLTTQEAANAIPGVAEQQTTFAQIQIVTLAIALLVVALFFALLTVERTGLYGVLKAMGSRTSRIFAGVVLQAFVVTMIAGAIGSALVLAAGYFIPPGSVPFALSPGLFLTSAGSLALAAIIGSAFSLRRVLAIDPAAAIGGDA
ncbi:MAG TPA: ABC transporter permease [Actinomycetales bacterium]|nr:ABC transporter permease [Actinomycetales bacterium]